jgi:hypothetical protein
LALFLICLWQVATSKKLLDRLSGFLDDIHDVPLFRSCAKKTGTRDASCNSG